MSISAGLDDDDQGPNRAQRLKITEVTARGLLGTFNHRIVFAKDWEFAIIFGPNGVGKTRLLELIRDAAELNQEALHQTPFEVLTMQFDDGSRLRFSKRSEDVAISSGISEEFEADLEADVREVCAITLQRPGRDDLHTTLKTGLSERFERWLEAATSWTRIDSTMWRDTSDDELASLGELYRRYDHVFLSGAGRARARRQRLAAIDANLVDFSKLFSVHLIETQRLITTGAERSYEPWEDVPPHSYVQTVTQHSDDLRKQLSRTITAHSRLSQQLDRTFPARIIEVDDLVASESGIREKYQDQNKLRARLAMFSLIDAQGEVALPERPLNEFEIKALSTYLDDTERKLEVFTGLLERLELFVDIMNSRLVRKTVSVDVNEGITVQQDHAGPAIPTERLSSGEQHEMVLLYDLLFRTQPSSTVLIDEPEISLHVAWQAQFLRDITRIARLSTLRFIIATHSPQIIDEWWARTNALDVG